MGFQRKPRSVRETELLERARAQLPAGVRSPTGSPESALVVASGHGARLLDVSGNEYIDYLMGSGPMILGHSHPEVVAAVREALERGSTYLMLSEPSIALAEEIVRAVPCAEKVSFHSAGSESVAHAIRIARAFRRRDAILKFEGGFHGMADAVLMSNQWTREPAPYPAAVPNSAGVPQAAARDVRIAPFNDIETTLSILDEHHAELAAVLVEPLQRTIPPHPGFLEALRKRTRELGIPLIFDEMVTGFRLAYGGAQAYYGVTPDLCTLGKAISGGHPLSVLCGRADLLSLVDPARAGGGDYVLQTGTYSGNPISATAALATLAVLRREGSYARLFSIGRRLMAGLSDALADAGIPAQVTGEPPAFEVWFGAGEIVDFRSTLDADPALHARFSDLLLAHGILKAHEKFFVSLAHSDADIERTLDVFRIVAQELAREQHTGPRD